VSDSPAWTALGLSVANSGVLLVHGWRSRHHRRAAGPSPEIRAALSAIREECQTVIAEGGAYGSWFLDDVRRTTDQRLDDLAKRTDDDKLRRLLSDVASSWRRGFAHAPDSGLGIYVLGKPETASDRAEDAARAERMKLVVEAIRTALASTEAALDRVNHLERRL
jgi:hypothetical protein